MRLEGRLLHEHTAHKHPKIFHIRVCTCQKWNSPSEFYPLVLFVYGHPYINKRARASLLTEHWQVSGLRRWSYANLPLARLSERNSFKDVLVISFNFVYTFLWVGHVLVSVLFITSNRSSIFLLDYD